MTARLLTLAAVFVIVAGGLTADDKKKAGPPDMEAMMKMAQPGDAHKVFQTMAGKWKYTGKWYMPGAAAMDVSGTVESEIIMDGRYLSDHVQSDDAGKTFQGRGWWGYDNMKKKYWYSWIDSMGTALTVADGSWDPKTKTMTSMSESFDPSVGKMVKMKDVTVVKGNTMDKTFYTVDGGKEVKNMEMHFTRVK